MLDVTGLVAVATAFFLVAASPGPATVALATVSMSAGRRAGWQFGLGLSLGLAFWGASLPPAWGPSFRRPARRSRC